MKYDVQNCAICAILNSSTCLITSLSSRSHIRRKAQQRPQHAPGFNYYTHFLNGPTVFLGEFYVDKSEQGSGILRTVYQRLETDWKNSGFTKGVLNVDLKNTAGILFWIKMGLKPSTLHSTRTPAKKGRRLTCIPLTHYKPPIRLRYNHADEYGDSFSCVRILYRCPRYL